MKRKPGFKRRLSYVPALRWLQWVLLCLTVLLLAFGYPEWVNQGVVEGSLPRIVLLLPAIFFGLFFVSFGFYRFLLVRAGKYNAAKGFVQLGLGALVLMFLLTPNIARYKAAASETQISLVPLLSSPDPQVRIVACEALAGRKRNDPGRKEAQRLALEDPDPMVRFVCSRVR